LIAPLLQWIFRHKFLSGLIVFVIVALSLIETRKLRLQKDIIDLLPAKDTFVRTYLLLLTHFQRENIVIFQVGPPERHSVTQREVENTVEALAENLAKEKVLKEIVYKADPSELNVFLQFILKHQDNLFTEQDRKQFEQRISLESIRKILAEKKRRLFESPVPSVLQNLNQDPLGFAEVFIDRATGFWTSSSSIKILDSYFYSRDRNHILMIGQPAEAGIRNSEGFITKLQRVVQEVEAGTQGRVDIAYLAPQRFAYDNAMLMKGDIQKTIVLSFVAIGLLASLAFRRPISSSLLTLLPAAFGGLVAAGMMVLIYGTVSAISIGCGAMLAGVVVDFGIHLLYHFDHSAEPQQDRNYMIGMVKRLFVPMSVAAGNTVVAFLILQTSILPGYRQLALFAAMSVVASFLFAFLFLPVLAFSRKPARREAFVRLENVFYRIFVWIDGHQQLLRRIGLILLLISLAGLAKLRFEGDVQKLNGVTEETRKDWRAIEKNFGDIEDKTSVIVRGKTLEEALQKNDRILGVLQGKQQEKRVIWNQSISRLLPSLRTQEENLQRWIEFWNPERRETLRTNFLLACSELRMNCAVFEPFFAGLQEMPHERISPDNFQGSILRGMLDTQISRDKNDFLILSEFRVQGQEDLNRMIDDVRKTAPDALWFDGDLFVGHVIDLTRREMLKLATITLFFVTLIFWIYARNIREVGTLLLPLVMSVGCTFGIMGWLGIRVDLVNSLMVIFVFGLIDDYCVFLYSAFRESGGKFDQHLLTTSGALTLSAAATLVGFGSLALAKHPSLHGIGVTALLAITIGLIVVLVSLTTARKGSPGKESKQLE
jgi:predicted exporter